MSNFHPAGEGQWRCPLHLEPLLPSQYLRKSTYEEEMLLWRRFLDNKVLLSFGKAFECKEPGWFRVIFSDKVHRLRLGEQPPLHCIPQATPPLLAPTCPPISAHGSLFPLLRDAEDPAGA